MIAWAEEKFYAIGVDGYAIAVVGQACHAVWQTKLEWVAGSLVPWLVRGGWGGWVLCLFILKIIFPFAQSWCEVLVW